MSRISKSKLLSAASAITIATFSTSVVNAQEKEAGIVEEEMMVTGIRGSIRGSINDKRTSGQIVDSIVAHLAYFPQWPLTL